MSRVRYTPIGTADARSSTVINGILDDLSTASASIDEGNLAEEGLDQTVFLAHQHATRRERITPNTRTTIVPQAWATLAVPTNVRSANLGALLDGSVLRIRTLIRCEATVSNGLGFDSISTDDYEFRVVWFDGVTQTVVNASRRTRGQIPQVVANFRQGHGDMLWSCYLQGPIAQITWIEVQYQNLGFRDINIDRVNFTVDEFKRVELL